MNNSSKPPSRRAQALLAVSAIGSLLFAGYELAPRLLAAAQTDDHTTAAAVTDSERPAAVADVVAKALAFKALLTTAQQATLEQTYTTTLARRWSNLPCGSSCRNGIQLSTLNATQLAAALDLIRAASGTAANEGYDEFNQVRQADGVLNANGGGSGYGDGIYFLAFLNTPSTSGPWMLQYGGHHYGANIAYNQGHVVGTTPMFEALEPTSWTANGVTYSPLAQEHDALAAMLASLDATQLAAAKLSQTFSDVSMSPGESNGGNGTFPSTKVGLAVSSLSTAQKQLVLEAMRPWVRDMDDTVAANLMAIYESELNGTYIAFTGSGTSGSASSFLNANTNYARIDGPSVWIEFACQSGVVFRNQIHYHTVWRDHNRDYGKDLSLTTALDGGSSTGIEDSSPQTISQIADGSGWKSTIILANTGTATASFTARFWNGSGAALTLPLGSDGTVSELSGTIPVNGLRVIETAGTATALSQGWAELLSNDSIGGTAVFRQQVSGRADAEGAVPVTSPASKRLLLPFDNTSGFTTAAALVNPSASASATVQATIYDETGASIGTGSIALAARGQTAFALTDRFPATAGKRGLVDFSNSTTSITGLGLRFQSNGTFTSIEMLPPPSANSTAITSLLDGAGWTTGLVLTNASALPSSYRVSFYSADDGSAAAATVAEEGAVQELSGQIPPHGSRYIATAGIASTRQQALAKIETQGQISAAAVYRLQSGPDVSEAVAPVVSRAARRLLVPYDNTDGGYTLFTFRNLAALGRTLPSKGSNRTSRGIAEFENAGSVSASGVALHVSGNGVLRALPVIAK
ncbi:MAG: DUF3500 domain-containing protein [Acidobacteria bacterium]|nr:DUF3500 domain-containing protein [Acidobacteriota bacterium]